MKTKKITQNVNKDSFMNDLPKVKPQNSQWLTRHTNYQASYLGDIVPVYFDEVLPDEKRKVTLGMISHTNTPIAPIFPAVYTEFRSFFIPMRLAADLLNGYKTRKSPWVKVFGEDNTSTDADIIVPLDEQKLPSLSEAFIGEIESYLEGATYTDNVFDSLDITNFVSSQNFLNLAAYELVYQRHYRNENFESPTQSELYRTLFDAYNQESSVRLDSDFRYERANREKDYFTGCKPYTQKSEQPISINIGDEAKLKLTEEGYALTEATQSVYPTKNLISNVKNADQGSTEQLLTAGGSSSSITNLVADLTSAKGISIEELRLLIKTQELLEKDLMYGTRYSESLNAHFGCCPIDETLQDPAELYKVTITSNMQAIFQTSATKDEESILGTIGANSTTQTEPFVIVPETKFKEHGILMICMVHKLQNVYDCNYFRPKFNFKRSRFDFYTPELNDLGFQPVTDLEAGINEGNLGYNEAFAEYRYKFNKSHGSLNTDFQYWAPAIADEYSSISALYKEGVNIFDKALSVSSSQAPQFYDAFGFEEYNDKPMSLHSIPGMDGVI